MGLGVLSRRLLLAGALALSLCCVLPASSPARHHVKKRGAQVKRRATGPSAPELCKRLSRRTGLTDAQRQALQAACAQLKADTQAAQDQYKQAMQAIEATVAQARDAARQACAGDKESEACAQARQALEAARKAARDQARVARDQLRTALDKAMGQFKAAVRAALPENKGPGGGDKPSGGGSTTPVPTALCNPVAAREQSLPPAVQQALQAACAQLKADVLAAQTQYKQAMQVIEAAVAQARVAAGQACAGDKPSEACTQARQAFAAARANAESQAKAAKAALEAAISAAQEQFRATVSVLFKNAA